MGPIVTVQKATRLMVISLFGYIVMLLQSLFHSPHVLHSQQGKGESLYNTRTH